MKETAYLERRQQREHERRKQQLPSAFTVVHAVLVPNHLGLRGN